jgi:Flp pilus assembly pilin Flp
MKRIRRGQSTLEYVIILAAVVGAIIAIASMFTPKLQNTYTTIGTTMENKVKDVDFSK